MPLSPAADPRLPRACDLETVEDHANPNNSARREGGRPAASCNAQPRAAMEGGCQPPKQLGGHAKALSKCPLAVAVSPRAPETGDRSSQELKSPSNPAPHRRGNF